MSSLLNWICWTPPPRTKFLGTPLFCRDMTLYQLVIWYRRFEATYSPHTEASEVQVLNSDLWWWRPVHSDRQNPGMRCHILEQWIMFWTFLRVNIYVFDRLFLCFKYIRVSPSIFSRQRLFLIVVGMRLTLSCSFLLKVGNDKKILEKLHRVLIILCNIRRLCRYRIDCVTQDCIISMPWRMK